MLTKPTPGLPPAPSPRVSLLPICTLLLVGRGLAASACQQRTRRSVKACATAADTARHGQFGFAQPGTTVSCVCMQRGLYALQSGKAQLHRTARPHGHAGINLASSRMFRLTCASVFITYISTPVSWLANMRLTAFEPPPPTPTTCMQRCPCRGLHQLHDHRMWVKAILMA
jgi:hypothetical protein